MTETRTEYKGYKVDVLTLNGQNFLGVDHKKFAKQAGMVYLAGVEESEDGSEIESVMIPESNIKHIREYSKEEEVEIPTTAQNVQNTPGASLEEEEEEEEAEEEEPEEEEESEQSPPESFHLPDMTVDDLQEEIDEVHNVDYLEACIEEDDRVTAVEEYEERIEELQS